jgi:hypothetical protein
MRWVDDEPISFRRCPPHCTTRAIAQQQAALLRCSKAPAPACAPPSTPVKSTPPIIKLTGCQKLAPAQHQHHTTSPRPTFSHLHTPSASLLLCVPLPFAHIIHSVLPSLGRIPFCTSSATTRRLLLHPSHTSSYRHCFRAWSLSFACRLPTTRPAHPHPHPRRSLSTNLRWGHILLSGHIELGVHWSNRVPRRGRPSIATTRFTTRVSTRRIRGQCRPWRVPRRARGPNRLSASKVTRATAPAIANKQRSTTTTYRTISKKVLPKREKTTLHPRPRQTRMLPWRKHNQSLLLWKSRLYSPYGPFNILM